MAEQTIWQGRSSHWKYSKAHALAVVGLIASVTMYFMQPDRGAWWYFLPAIFTAAFSFWRWLVNVSTEFRITSERLQITTGILTKVTNSLELYRVRDLQIVQPFFQRLLGLHNVHLITTDSTSAEIIMDYVPARLNLGDELRRCIEVCRSAKGVRTLDMTNETAGDHPAQPHDPEPGAAQ